MDGRRSQQVLKRAFICRKKGLLIVHHNASLGTNHLNQHKVIIIIKSAILTSVTVCMACKYATSVVTSSQMADCIFVSVSLISHALTKSCHDSGRPYSASSASSEYSELMKEDFDFGTPFFVNVLRSSHS
jgi:hypothetical protein